MKIVFPGEAHPAVDLNAAIAHRAARVARVQLGDGHRRSGIGGVMLESPCGVVDGGTSAFRFEVHVGALVLHRLKNADGLSELFSGLRILDGEVEGALHSADHFGSESGGGNGARPRQTGCFADFLAGHIVKPDGIEFAREIHAEHRLNADSRGFRIDEEDAVLRNDDNPISDCSVRNEQLFPFQLAVSRRQAHIGKIPAPFGLKECNRGARLSSTDWCQVFPLLCRRGESIQESSRHYYRGEKRAGKQRAASFLHKQNQLEDSEGNAAEFFGKDNAGVTLLRKFGPQVRAEGGIGLHETPDFGHGALAGKELAGAVTKKFLAFVQSKLHRIFP